MMMKKIQTENGHMIGKDIYSLCEKMFPHCRSITGDGVRQTLKDLEELLPTLIIQEIPTGTKVFDWTVPKEWNIRNAWIKNESGDKVLDFHQSNLHVLGYSAPIDKVLSLSELKEIIYTQPDQPELIPYVTSYYKERVGFCMSEQQKNSLPEGKYHAYIDSDLKDGSLTFGELIIPGQCDREIFLSTYICHPSLANDNLSGIAVLAYLGKWLSSLPKRRYTYRLIFVPETIGALSYLHLHYKYLKDHVIAGFNLSCVGDDRTYSYISSRYGNTLADKVAQNVLSLRYPAYKRYSFLKRSSDERQYCAPEIDLPLCMICRSKHMEYPEYHTSADNLNLISPEGLQGSYEVYRDCLLVLENNRRYKTTCIGEPQLGKRGLYPTISQKGSACSVISMLDFLAYADGTNDLIDISHHIGVDIMKILQITDLLKEHGLIKEMH